MLISITFISQFYEWKQLHFNFLILISVDFGLVLNEIKNAFYSLSRISKLDFSLNLCRLEYHWPKFKETTPPTAATAVAIVMKRNR